MPESQKPVSNRAPLERLQAQVGRLPDRPSALSELGHALAGQPGPIRGPKCAAYQETLPDYVEAELNGQPARHLFPDLARHLDLCPNCGQAYVDLMEPALEAEAKPLPVPTSAPALDLSFLPPLTTAERIRQVIEPLVKELLRRLNPGSLADLPAAGHAFFQRFRELGTDIQIQPGWALALGFGSALPPALQSLVAAYATTVKVIQTISIEELDAELGSARPSIILRKHARSAAREVGMSRKEADRWAELYAAQVHAQATDFLALARQMAEYEQPG